MKNTITAILLAMATLMGCDADNEPGDADEPGIQDSSNEDTEISDTSLNADSSTDDTENSIADSDEPSSCPSGAIVSLTYDDGLASHLSVVAPALDALGLKATFFVTRLWQPDPWATLVLNGHEIGSHTMTHPCAGATWARPSEEYTMAEIIAELDSSIAQLETLGAQAPFSFAWPCGTTWVGGNESYIPEVEQRFVAARGVSGTLATAASNIWNVPAYFLTGPATTLTSLVDSAIASGNWAVFGFHDVGTGSLAPTSEADHQALLDYLVANKDSVTVMPFGQAAACRLKNP